METAIKQQNISIDYLSIEVTRRCNMSCLHCLRGDAEDCDMNMRYVNTLFKKIDHIGNLTITGGEPSLATSVINKIIKAAQIHNVDVSSFYLVTNARSISKQFIFTLLRMYVEFNNDWSETTAVEYSNDNYHPGEPDTEGLQLLKGLSFFSPRNENDDAEYSLLSEGKAPDYYQCRHSVTPECFDVNVDEDQITVNEGTLYLNCKGMLVAGCDWSYATQDDPDSGVQVCRVKDFTIEKLIEFANRDLEE